MILELTNDRSHTIRSSVYGEMYHSKYGAIQESLHVFIKNGLHHVIRSDRDTRVFEVGFGSGLNAYLAAQLASRLNVSLTYHSIELHPLEEHIWSALNYPSLLNGGDSKVFDKIHHAAWNEEVAIDAHFKLQKIHSDISAFYLKESHYDIIFFDAFAPSTQEELWTTEIFVKMHNCLISRGLLATYCAKGYVKRNLKAAGFRVVAVAGPPGKREMTLALKGDWEDHSFK